ncbi:MAG: hypothetical protein ACFE91_11135 [Promethearchaeota archaeon]
MDFIVYRVIFRAQEQLEIKNLTLSFRNLDFEKPIIVHPKFISDLKTLSEKNQNIINIQNIEEVLIIGNPKIDYPFNYYLVLLLTEKSDRKKTGYLISNVKKLGDIIIGIWPFNTQLEKLIRENIRETFNEILKNPNKYNSITLISQ